MSSISSSIFSGTLKETEMAENVKQILYSHLKELEKKELHIFRSLLDEHPPSAGWSKIPKRQRQKAEYIEIVDRMIRDFKEERALEAAADLLCHVKRRDLSEHLQQVSQEYLRQKQCENRIKVLHRKNYRKGIVDTFRKYEENICVGEWFVQNERYPKLLIANKSCHLGVLEHDIVSSVKRYQRIMSQSAEPPFSNVAELFVPDKYGHTPRIIVLLGAAGIGKTTTAQKIMADWALGELYQDRFEYAMYIHCKDIKKIPGQQTIADLLWQSYCEMCKPIHGLVVEPEKLLFIIDGFSDLKCPLDLSEGERGSNTPIENLQGSLLRKNLVNKSYIIITTRPTALEKLSKFVKIQHFEELLGFSEEDTKEYFNRFFGNAEVGTQAFQLVQENAVLLSMCFVPIICWIVCTVIKQQMKKGDDLAHVSRTFTAVYMSFLTGLLKEQSSDTEQHMQTILKGLCALAKDGICEKKILFEEDDMNKHSLNLLDIQSLFQKNYIFHRSADCHNVYNFIHMTFQEFFAALYLVLRENEERTDPAETSERDVINVLGAYRKRNHNHLMLTVRFLFGLFNKETLSQLEECFRSKISSEVKNDLLLWIKEEIKQNCSEMSNYLMDLMYCLYEIQDEGFVKSAMEPYENVEIVHFLHQITKTDFSVLLFCLKNSPGIRKLHITNYKIGAEDLAALVPWTQKCSSLKLSDCSLTGPCCGVLCSMINTNTNLTELDLSFNELTDSGVSQLCERLKHPGCKLQKLDLSRCSLTGSCCPDLASLLSMNPSVTELSLSDNPLGGSGVARLCEGLRHPECRVQKLNLDLCSITGACCGDLSSVLCANQFLTELNLMDSKLGDSGMRQVCEGLKHPGCRMQKVDLCGCSLTGTCCADLALALSTNSSLTELNLSRNELGDTGVSQLCDGLKHNGCCIQKLELVWCSLKGSCCEDLASVLSTNPSLTELHLGDNELQDSGVRQLCQGLKHPGCKIQKLELWLCSITSSCCEDLASALKAQPSLTKLSLSDNKLEDSGVRHLCEVFRHPDCKIQTLELDSTSLTDNCVTELCSAISTSPTLQRLSLHSNHFTDISITSFIQLKKTCGSLRDLWLSGCKFSARGLQELRALLDGAA